MLEAALAVKTGSAPGSRFAESGFCRRVGESAGVR